MGMIDRVNNNLKSLFDTTTLQYRELICDKDGTIPETITKPTDINIGAVASNLEWLRIIALLLIDQLYIDKASGAFLKYQLSEFFDSLQLEDETDVDWVQRTIATVFQPKVSRASIIVALRPYSTQEPEISSIITESAFGDFSYADAYVRKTFYYPAPVGTIYVFPAIAQNYENSFYTIKVTLYNTASEDLYTVKDILNKIIAAGISYVLVIKYT